MKSLLVYLLLLATPVLACDTGYPNGIKAHQLTVTYAFTIHYPDGKTVLLQKDIATAATNFLNQIAADSKTNVKFQKVAKESAANLVFRTHIYFDRKADLFRAYVFVYGLGKPYELFEVVGVAAPKEGETQGDTVVRAYGNALGQAFDYITSGWQCGVTKVTGQKDPKF